MLNKDYAGTTAGIIRSTFPNITAPKRVDMISLLERVGNDYQTGLQRRADNQLTDEMIAQNPEDEARIRQMGGRAYADMLDANAQRAEERQWKLDDIANQQAFQREMQDRVFANSRMLAELGKASGNGGEPAPEFDAKTTTDLRKEFRANSKEYFQIGDQYGKMREAAATPSAAGDVAMIFSFMKMLDPNSVVREGEYANAQNAAGVPARVVAAYNRAIDGTRLTAEQRADFLNQGKKFYDTQKKRFTTEADWYRKIAQSTRANPDFVVQDPYNFDEPAQSGATEGTLPNGVTWRVAE